MTITLRRRVINLELCFGKDFFFFFLRIVKANLVLQAKGNSYNILTQKNNNKKAYHMNKLTSFENEDK